MMHAMTPPIVYLDKNNSNCGVKGTISKARGSDTAICAFRGIPYAEPPIGKLRFRPPEPIQLWTGVTDATQFGPACPQDLNRVKATYGHLPNHPSKYSEDCLFLNVWSPAVGKSTKNLPVMVWIHGGAFVQGFSNLYDGTPLAAYEHVVVVSINYRLGVFGFLRTGANAKEYHGNQGLLDQTEALRWIKRYIDNFGGDPDNVTIFGESAGGSSVALLTLSPLAKGLFCRAICQSGTNMTFGMLWTAKQGEKYFWKRLDQMGYKRTNHHNVTEFLETKSTTHCLQAFSDWFVPCILDNIFLSEQPLEVYKSQRINSVDCIIGFNSSEGYGFISSRMHNQDVAKKTIGELISKNFLRGCPPSALKRITALALREYVKGTTSDELQEAVCSFYGDINFVAPSLRQAELHSKRGQTYVYYFDYRPTLSRQPAWVKADHAHEIPFVFGFPFREDLDDAWPHHEKTLSRTLMNYWANFARIGNPNGDSGCVWNHFTEEQPLHLSITDTMPKIGMGNVRLLSPERVYLWNKMVPEILMESETEKSKY